MTQTLRHAEQVIRRTDQSSRAPVTLWQELGETLAAFDARVIAARRRVAVNVALLAVCEPHPTLLDGVTLCELTKPMLELLHPKRPARYRGAYSGRGAGKSWCFARALVVRALTERLRILCARELQTSIQESVHKLLSDQIDLLGLWQWFEIQQASITATVGSEFIFAGIRNNPTKLKSTEGIDIAWLEEAEKITKDSWQILIPTIRKKGSEIYVSFNPDQADDPTYERIVTNEPPNSRVIKTSWRDNPWLSEELTAEKDYLARVDADAYAHLWEGGFCVASDAQILKGKCVIEAFEPSPYMAGPYIGLDFGFSVDPTAAIKCYVVEKTLMISHEAYAIGCDIDRTPKLLDDAIPDIQKYTVRADCARPETISYLQRNGFPKVESVQKWTGSVEDGIAHLRGYERIVVHPRCSHFIEESRLWSYKTDRLTGDVLPDVKSGNDHLMDACRYALQPVIRGQHTVSFGSIGSRRHY